MARALAWRSAIALCAWLVAAAAGVILVALASVTLSDWLIDRVANTNGDHKTAAERSALGDYFGGVSAVFSGLALILLIVTLFLQRRELRLQRQEVALQRQELAASRDELRRSAASDLRNLHIQLTQMAAADPALAEVWNAFPGESDEGRRQMLFANLSFNHFVLAHSWGSFSEAELLVNAHGLLRSPVFRRYWEATRALKSQLPSESEEGRTFLIFEQAFADLRRNPPPPAR